MHTDSHELELCPPKDGGGDLIGQSEGYIIGARGHALMRFAPDTHMITVAATGGGKGRSVAITNLLDHPGSVFSIEIGGATFRDTFRYRKEILGQEIHLFDPFGATGVATNTTFNPMDLLNPDDSSFSTDVKRLARTIMSDSDGRKEQNPYWERTPKDLLRALLIYVKTSPDVSEDDRHLPYLAELLSLYPSAEWDALMECLTMWQGPEKTLLNFVGNYYSGSTDENVRGLVSSVMGPLEFAQDPAIANIIKKSSIDLKNLREKKISMYVVMKEIEQYHENSTFLRLMVESAFKACPNTANAGKDIRHNDRILFMLDEFTQLGKLQAVELGMVTARAKGITIWSLFQAIPLLEKTYGKQVADSFFGQAGVVQIFEVGDEPTKEYVSKKAGERIALIPGYTHGVNYGESSQQNWSTTETLGIQESFTEGVAIAETESWQSSQSYGRTDTFGKSESTGVSLGKSSSFGYNHSSSSNSTNRNKQNTTSSSTATQSNRTEGIGGASGKTENTAKTKGTNKQKGKQEGQSHGQSVGASYQVSYTPHILPNIKPWQVEKLLSTDNRQILFIRGKGDARVILDRRANYDQNPVLRKRAYGPEVPTVIEEFDSLPAPVQLKDFSLDIQPLSLSIPAVDFSRPFPSYEKVLREKDHHANILSRTQAQTRQEQSRKSLWSKKHVLQASREREISAVLAAGHALAESNETYAKSVRAWNEHWLDSRASVLAFRDNLARKAGRISDYIAILNTATQKLGRYQAKNDDYRQKLAGVFNHCVAMEDDLTGFQDVVREYGLYRRIWPEAADPQKPVYRELPDGDFLNSEKLEALIDQPVPSLSPSLPALPGEVKCPEIRDTPSPMTVNPLDRLNTMRVKVEIDGFPTQITLPELERKIADCVFEHPTLRKAAELFRETRDVLGHEDTSAKTRLMEAKYLLAHEAHARIGSDISMAADANAALRSEWEEQRTRWKDYHHRLCRYNQELDATVLRLKKIAENLGRHKVALDSFPSRYLEAKKALERRRTGIINKIAQWDIWDQLEQERRLMPQLQLREQGMMAEKPPLPRMFTEDGGTILVEKPQGPKL